MIHSLPDGEVHVGHVLDSLAAMPTESVQTCITSPPYWGLRKYSGEQVTAWSDGQWAYGLEPTPDAWADHTAEWLRAVRRVLRKDGLAFVNVGDSYSGGGRGDTGRGTMQDSNPASALGTQIAPPGYKPLDLIHTPSLLIPRLLADGWYVRSVIVWSKPNPMPESVSGTRWERHKARTKAAPVNRMGFQEEARTWTTTAENGNMGNAAEWSDCEGCATCAPNDGLVLRRGSWRPTDSTEWILMLAKSANYWADGEGVREPNHPDGRQVTTVVGQEGSIQHRDGEGWPNPAGRNLRNVWTFPTEPFPQAHFATYPTELVRRCILASTPDAGVCAVCGAPWARVISSASGGTIGQSWHDHSADASVGMSQAAWSGGVGNAAVNGERYQPRSTLGWRPTCSHSEAQPSVVLDPFGGSGTTGVVARSLGRRFVLCELSESYVAMALKRLTRTQPAMGLV